MNEIPLKPGQYGSAKESIAGRPEPEYVDEVFEDEVYLDDIPGEATASRTSRTEPVNDFGGDVAADIKSSHESNPEPTTPSAPPRMPGPTHRVTGRSSRSRIPHRLAAAKKSDSGKTIPTQAEPRETGAQSRRSIVRTREQMAGIGNAAAEAIPAEEAHGIDPIGPPPASVPPVKAEIPAWFLLEDILKENEDLPEGSLILGIQEDGKPLVLSLDDTSMGAVLITGDAADANRKHLHAILASAEKLISPELLQVDVIDRIGDGFKSNSSILRRNCAATDPCVFEILGEYLDEIETRLREDRQLPFRILILDEIEELTGRLAEDSLRYMRWMMRRGPKVGIWIFASIETARLPEFDSKTFRAFDLRLYGKIREKETAERYTEISPQLLKKLTPGTEGCFKLDDDVIRFSIPEFAG